MTRKQCNNGKHLKPGDTYIELVESKDVFCMKCLRDTDKITYKGRPLTIKDIRYGYYKRTVFHK